MFLKRNDVQDDLEYVEITLSNLWNVVKHRETQIFIHYMITFQLTKNILTFMV